MLRFGPSVRDLFVFESVEEGVRMVPWAIVRSYCGSYYDMIGFRKLNGMIEVDKLASLDRFRRKTTGR